MIKIIFVILLFVSSKVLAQDESFSESYFKTISVATIAAHCSDDKLLKHMGYDRKQCINALSDNAKTCNKTLKPFVFEIKGDEGANEMQIYKNIGAMYSMCMQSFILDLIISK